MSEGEVDLSQIRGDWNFHINYVNNAVNQTLKRALSMWKPVAGDLDGSIGDAVQNLSSVWSKVNGDLDEKGSINVKNPGIQEFIDAARATKDPLDAAEEKQGAGGSSSHYDTPLEQFTEAVRQVRGYCDDLEMMREQRPY